MYRQCTGKLARQEKPFLLSTLLARLIASTMFRLTKLSANNFTADTTTWRRAYEWSSEWMATSLNERVVGAGVVWPNLWQWPRTDAVHPANVPPEFARWRSREIWPMANIVYLIYTVNVKWRCGSVGRPCREQTRPLSSLTYRTATYLCLVRVSTFIVPRCFHRILPACIRKRCDNALEF